MTAMELHNAIAVVSPINGVSLGDRTDPLTWRVDFKDGASFYYRDTPRDQRETDVAAVIANFTHAK